MTLTSNQTGSELLPNPSYVNYTLPTWNRRPSACPSYSRQTQCLSSRSSPGCGTTGPGMARWPSCPLVVLGKCLLCLFDREMLQSTWGSPRAEKAC